MKSLNKVGLAAIVVVTIVLSTALVYSAAEMPLFIKTAGFSEFETREEGTYVANITDGNTRLRTFYFSISPAPSGVGNVRQHRIFIQTATYAYTELDSVIFRFYSPFHVYGLYSKASSYIWEESVHTERNGAIYSVADLGEYGKHTVNFEFIIELPAGIDKIYLDIDMSMHQMTPLQVTSLEAHGFLQVTIPPDID